MDTLTFFSFFPSGSIQCRVVVIVDDSMVEENETFSLIVTFPDAQVNVTTSIISITIVDDDCKCLP